MQPQTEQVSAIISGEEGSAIVGLSETGGEKESEEEWEPGRQEDSAASSKTSCISPVTRPLPENHLVT